MSRADLMARVGAWLEEDRPADDGEPCRELVIEHGVSARPGETWTVYLHDTGAWATAVDAWEASGEGEEPKTGWWDAWGAGLTLDEALAAALADLERPSWGRPS